MILKLKILLTLLTVIWLGFGAFLLIGGPVIPYFFLDQLELGMTEDEVEAILGKPSAVLDGEWQYDRFGNPGWVEIYFDDDGRFVDINDESPVLPSHF